MGLIVVIVAVLLAFALVWRQLEKDEGTRGFRTAVALLLIIGPALLTIYEGWAIQRGCSAGNKRSCASFDVIPIMVILLDLPLLAIGCAALPKRRRGP